MPSRAETRVSVEHGLRAVVIFALAAMLWRSVGKSDGGDVQTISARDVSASTLTNWSTAPKPPVIEVQLDRLAAPIERSWLAALDGAGSVTWRGDLPYLMIGAQPIAFPAGGTRVFVAAPNGTSVALGADGAATDTVRAQHVGARLALGSSANRITAAVNGSFASAAQRDSVLLRRLLVIGRPGWESKFTVAALEEDGWKVDALIRVAPNVEVTQGSLAAIDTSRYSAVIALDGAATPYANRMMEFARVGGGVVLTSRATSTDAMAGLRAGTIGRTPPQTLAPSSAVSLASLALSPITSMRSDALPLERRSGAVATAARRIGAGRAVQVGYEDTWRWRMSGAEGAVPEHRQWWTEIVASVAYAPRVPRGAIASAADGAPMIGLVAAIGPPVQAGVMSNLTGPATGWMAWLFVLFALALIGEIASRRLRGAS